MKQTAIVSGDILEGVSATTLWTLHNRGTEAKRSYGVIRDPSPRGFRPASGGWTGPALLTN